MRAPALFALVAFALPLAAPAEKIDLKPDEPASWSATSLVAPITSLFVGGPRYWYGERTLEIETTPPGAVLDLFYVRANFQKRYEQADAPITVVLPSRNEAGPRDSVTIRALLDGYRQQERHVRVRSRESDITIELEPLPNSLVAVTHVSLGGRASLTFLTKEAPEFRLQKSDDGMSVILNETANTSGAEETLDGLGGSVIDSVRAQQLGEDLVLRVALAEEASSIEPRSRQSVDPVRRLHRFSLELVPADGGAAAVERARAALDRVGPEDATGCARAFDEALREKIDPAALSRALTPNGSFTDPYLRAALKRLGEVSPGGIIELTDGTGYRAAVPLELAAAGSRAAEARGYLAVLHRFALELDPDHGTETFRGLVAPEIGPRRFAILVEGAQARAAGCRAGG